MPFFRLRRGLCYEGRGADGKLVIFTDKPVEILDQKDAEKFSNQRDILVETNEAGESVEKPRSSPFETTIYRPARGVGQPSVPRSDQTIVSADVGKRRRLPKSPLGHSFA